MAVEGVRTLSRSKALKSGSRLRKSWPEWLFTEPSPVLEGALRRRSVRWLWPLTGFVERFRSIHKNSWCHCHGSGSHEQTREFGLGVWEDRTANAETGAPDRMGFPGSLTVNQRQESNERREAGLLAEREKLRRPKSYGRMWRETKPQGSGGIKPLRRWETLRADGAGKVNQHNDHLSWFRRKETNLMEGASTSRCVSCTATMLRLGHRGRRPTARKVRWASSLRWGNKAGRKGRGRNFSASPDFGRAE